MVSRRRTAFFAAWARDHGETADRNVAPDLEWRLPAITSPVTLTAARSHFSDDSHPIGQSSTRPRTEEQSKNNRRTIEDAAPRDDRPRQRDGRLDSWRSPSS